MYNQNLKSNARVIICKYICIALKKEYPDTKSISITITYNTGIEIMRRYEGCSEIIETVSVFNKYAKHLIHYWQKQ